MTRNLLEVRHLRVEYLVRDQRPAVAVNNVSFNVGAGEIVGLAGESGCGKSTIAQSILRILGPPGTITNGRILFDGQDILNLDEDQLNDVRWRQIALVFQSAMNSLNPVLNIGTQIVDVLRAHTGVTRRAAWERAEQLIESVGIDRKRLLSYPHQLSGGMRQRAVIAMALALEPRLLILDEPTTALDVVVQREILEELVSLKEQRGFSILFITHDLSLMLELSDRIVMLYAGRVIEHAPASAVLKSPRHPYTQGLLNSFPPLSGPRVELTGIAGTPPRLTELPSGCAFAPRCPHRQPECEESPPLVLVDGEHHAACWRSSPLETSS